MNLLDRYGAKRCFGYEITKIYEEEESAWKAGHQGVLSNLTAGARRRKIKVVLVWAKSASPDSCQHFPYTR